MLVGKISSASGCPAYQQAVPGAIPFGIEEHDVSVCGYCDLRSSLLEAT
jgi:hypothetical protein